MHRFFVDEKYRETLCFLPFVKKSYVVNITWYASLDAGLSMRKCCEAFEPLVIGLC